MEKQTEIVMANHDIHNFIDADTCYICDGEFSKSNYEVRDHCHRTGNYRGAARTTCNINYYNKRHPLVVFII